MIFPSFRQLVGPLVALLILCDLSVVRAEMVWFEAEDAKSTNMPKAADDPAIVSGGQWLEGRVAPGLYAEYDVAVKDGGLYDFQARRNWLHGAFQWRFDNQAWAVVDTQHQWILNKSPKPSKQGQLDWVDQGYVTLTPGKHTLRIEMLADSKYPFDKIFGFDCFVLANDGFMPVDISHDGGPRRPFGPPDESQYGRNLPRTMSLLESSNPAWHTRLSIVLYGQSIIQNSTIDLELRNYLLSKYPNVDIQMKKLAIGGYQAPILRKTAWQDLYTQNADLIVFHDYGGENGELEEIYRNIKTNTTAEVLTWTHHVDNFGAGVDAQRDASCVVLKNLADKYGWEIADVRAQWKDYLLTSHVPIQSLLVDQIHLNKNGTALLRDFLTPHFRDNPAASKDWENHIRMLPLNAPQKEITYDASNWTASTDGLRSTGTAPLRIKFYGNRLDLTPLPDGSGSAKILLDGQVPSNLPDTIAASRSTIAPGSWWPLISLVGLGKNRVPEKITLNFHDVSPDGVNYTYDVTSSVSGSEGTGKSGADFTAKSGHFSIAKGDIALDSVHHITKKDLPAQFTANFDMYSMSRDEWKSPKGLKPGTDDRTTVIRCWTDGPHEVEIIPNGDGPVALKNIMPFSPHGLNAN